MCCVGVSLVSITKEAEASETIGGQWHCTNGNDDANMSLNEELKIQMNLFRYQR